MIRSGGSRLSEQQEVEGELKGRGRPGFDLLYYESRSQNDMDDDDDDDHRSCSENTPVLIAMAMAMAMADGGWRDSSRFSALAVVQIPNKTRFDWIAPERERDDQDDGDGGSRRMIVKCRICIVRQHGEGCADEVYGSVYQSANGRK